MFVDFEFMDWWQYPSLLLAYDNVHSTQQTNKTHRNFAKLLLSTSFFSHKKQHTIS